MSQVLIQAGNRLLNALGRHSELIMQAYVNGSVKEADHSRKVLEQLVQRRRCCQQLMLLHRVVESQLLGMLI